MAIGAALGLRHGGETGKGRRAQKQWFQGHFGSFSTVGQLFAPSRSHFFRENRPQWRVPYPLIGTSITDWIRIKCKHSIHGAAQHRVMRAALFDRRARK
tara:strand:+ start:1021 stop:1317 length:297 start_codon:yes stop_codon:yes gene_type:complete